MSLLSLLEKLDHDQQKALRDRDHLKRRLGDKDYYDHFLGSRSLLKKDIAECYCLNDLIYVDPYLQPRDNTKKKQRSEVKDNETVASVDLMDTHEHRIQYNIQTVYERMVNFNQDRISVAELFFALVWYFWKEKLDGLSTPHKRSVHLDTHKR